MFLLRKGKGQLKSSSISPMSTKKNKTLMALWGVLESHKTKESMFIPMSRVFIKTKTCKEALSK